MVIEGKPTSFGVIAQLGERNNGIVEVWGSIPHGSTKIIKPVLQIMRTGFFI